MHGQFIQTREIALYVTVAGSGPPVLLLHGFPDSRLLWRHQIPALVNAGYRVIAPDLRGFGESDAPLGRQNYTLDRIAADVIDVLDHLGCFHDVRLAGHDWGAALGWHLLFRQGHRFSRYAALSVGHPAAFRDSGLSQWLRSWYMLAFQIPALPEFFLSAFQFLFLRSMTSHHPEHPRWIRDLSRTCRLTAALNWYRGNFWNLMGQSFPRVSVPVMGLWSTGDFALTEGQMKRSDQFLDGPWRYERVPDSSHWMPLDQPQRVNELLLQWFSAS